MQTKTRAVSLSFVLPLGLKDIIDRNDKARNVSWRNTEYIL